MSSEIEIPVVNAPAGAGMNVRTTRSTWSHLLAYMKAAAECAADPGDPNLRGSLYHLTSGKEVGLRQAINRMSKHWPNLRFAVSVQDREAGEYVITAHPVPEVVAEANTGAEGGVDGGLKAA